MWRLPCIIITCVPLICTTIMQLPPIYLIWATFEQSTFAVTSVWFWTRSKRYDDIGGIHVDVWSSYVPLTNARGKHPAGPEYAMTIWSILSSYRGVTNVAVFIRKILSCRNWRWLIIGSRHSILWAECRAASQKEAMVETPCKHTWLLARNF